MCALTPLLLLVWLRGSCPVVVVPVIRVIPFPATLGQWLALSLLKCFSLFLHSYIAILVKQKYLLVNENWGVGLQD